MILLTGCASQSNEPKNLTSGLTKEQQLSKIQNDASMPEGLKQIQTDTINNHSGLLPPSANAGQPGGAGG